LILLDGPSYIWSLAVLRMAIELTHKKTYIISLILERS
jgi:hypothetical protein